MRAVLIVPIDDESHFVLEIRLVLGYRNQIENLLERSMETLDNRNGAMLVDRSESRQDVQETPRRIYGKGIMSACSSKKQFSERTVDIAGGNAFATYGADSACSGKAVTHGFCSTDFSENAYGQIEKG